MFFWNKSFYWFLLYFSERGVEQLKVRLRFFVDYKFRHIRGQICCPKHVHKLFREVFSSGFSFTKKKYKMYKKKTSTKTMILFVEIIYFYKKKIQNVELFCRSFVEFKNCRRFFSHFCRNKNVVLTLWVFISLTTWFV